jgi:hypothetical protein
VLGIRKVSRRVLTLPEAGILGIANDADNLNVEWWRLSLTVRWIAVPEAETVA